MRAKFEWMSPWFVWEECHNRERYDRKTIENSKGKLEQRWQLRRKRSFIHFVNESLSSIWSINWHFYILSTRFFLFWISAFFDSFFVLNANWQILRCCTQMFWRNGRGSSNCVNQSGRFAFSKMQNNTFSKLCPPSKGNLLMGHFSERLTQNEIYFPYFHQYMQSQKWKLQCIVQSSTRHIIR